jgi:hypothetical protein
VVGNVLRVAYRAEVDRVERSKRLQEVSRNDLTGPLPVAVPQSNSVKLSSNPNRLWTARRTFTASAVTSIPIPSPGKTAMR